MEFVSLYLYMVCIWLLLFKIRFVTFIPVACKLLIFIVLAYSIVQMNISRFVFYFNTSRYISCFLFRVKFCTFGVMYTHFS